MKRCLILLTVLLLMLSGCSSGKGPVGAESPEELKSLFLQYHQDKDVENMLRLYNKKGVVESILKLERNQIQSAFDQELLNVSIQSLDREARDFFNQDIHTHGLIVAFNTYVEGQLSADHPNTHVSSFLFGKKKDGRYYFALQIYK